MSHEISVQVITISAFAARAEKNKVPTAGMVIHLLIKGAMMDLSWQYPLAHLDCCASIERYRWVPGMAFFPAWVSPRLMLWPEESLP